MKINKYLVAFLIIFILFISGCSIGPRLPEPKFLQGSKIYDINGTLITSLFKEKRTTIKIDKIPEVTKKAFISVEDSDFYNHHGISISGIARAAWKNFRAGAVVEGGSTITQQTAKNLFLGNERTFSRKFKELWYALQLERKYTKNQILEMYLNQIYLGEGAYGIEEAAKTYFGKSAYQLDLAESALLAGLPKAPSKYSPFNNWEAAKNRQQVVLARMVETNVISAEEAKIASNKDLSLSKNQKPSTNAPYFVNEIIKYVSENYEDGANLLFTGGLKIETTLDLNMQQAAEKSFAENLKNQSAELEGALIAMDPDTGYVKAMVGGRDFEDSKFNRALQAQRQPGSAFKPFVYTTAIEQGFTAGTTITCEPVQFNSSGQLYQPTDYGSQEYHHRPFTLKEALTISDNVVTVRLANQVGPQNVADYAVKMGITSPLRPYLSLALGTSEVTPLEMAAAYAPLANSGYDIKPIFIKKMTDSKGNVLEENRPQKNKVIDEKTAYIVTDMLKSVTKPGGTASIVSKVLKRPAAGKTGTTQNYADAWFVGYTPDLVAAVYLGYDTNRKSVGGTGGGLAAPLWANFMVGALNNYPARDFLQPPGLIKENICADTGLLATPYSENIIEAYFISGTEPTQPCPVHSRPGKSPFDNDLLPDWLAPEGPNDNKNGNKSKRFPKKNFFDWLY